MYSAMVCESCEKHSGKDSIPWKCYGCEVEICIHCAGKHGCCRACNARYSEPKLKILVADKKAETVWCLLKGDWTKTAIMKYIADFQNHRRGNLVPYKCPWCAKYHCCWDTEVIPKKVKLNLTAVE